VRLRALPLLLALTAADYALWDWSIADGHDIVSLVAGLTLLPLAAATLALLAVGAARLVRLVLERSSARGRDGLPRRVRARRSSAGRPALGRARAGRAADRPAGPAQASARPAETAAGRERSSRQLAA